MAAEATRIYETLKTESVDVLLDDRSERPGVKFKDADLLGIPIRLTVGARGLKENKVELKARNVSEATLVDVNDAVAQTLTLIAKMRILGNDERAPIHNAKTRCVLFRRGIYCAGRGRNLHGALPEIADDKSGESIAPLSALNPQWTRAPTRKLQDPLIAEDRVNALRH